MKGKARQLHTPKAASTSLHVHVCLVVVGDLWASWKKPAKASCRGDEQVDPAAGLPSPLHGIQTGTPNPLYLIPTLSYSNAVYYSIIVSYYPAAGMRTAGLSNRLHVSQSACQSVCLSVCRQKILKYLLNGRITPSAASLRRTHLDNNTQGTL